MCINTINIYILEDLENLLKIKQDTAALKFQKCNYWSNEIDWYWTKQQICTKISILQ